MLLLNWLNLAQIARGTFARLACYGILLAARERRQQKEFSL
jgi:hypothetical protein